MKVDITQRRDNPMLNRREIEGKVDHKDEATPSAEALKELLGKELGTDKENMEIDKIFTLKGKQESKFWAKEIGVSEKKAEKSTEEKEYECEECGKTFDTKRGLSIHKSQTHEKTEEVDYEEILSGTIAEAKEEIEGMENPDWERLLKTEKENKDRKGMKEYLEKKMG